MFKWQYREDKALRTSKIEVLEKDNALANLKDIVYIIAIYMLTIYDMYAISII